MADAAKAAQLGLTVTAAGFAAAMFDRVLPKVSDVRDQPPSVQQTARIRSQTTRTAVLVGLVGVGASLAVRSVWPAAGVAGVAAWMCWEYAAAAAAPVGEVVPVAPSAWPPILGGARP